MVVSFIKLKYPPSLQSNKKNILPPFRVTVQAVKTAGSGHVLI